MRDVSRCVSPEEVASVPLRAERSSCSRPYTFWLKEAPPPAIILPVTSDSIPIIVAVVLMAIFIFVAMLKRPKGVKTSKEAHDRRAAEATRRGWKLEVSGSGDEPVCVYSGTTDFIRWRCEMRAKYVARHGDDMRRQTAHTRWSTDAARLAQGLVIVMPASAGGELIPAGLPPEMLGRLAPLMEILGVDASDAPLVGTATVVDDPALNAHYRLRATDPAVLRQFLDGGARAALLEAAPWLAGSATAHPLVVATLGRRGLAVVLQGWVEDLEVVERVATVGSRLASARGQ